MNIEETGKLLNRISSYDNRLVTAVMVDSWHKIMQDISLEAALNAMEKHFIESTNYLMPFHIRERVKPHHAHPPVYERAPDRQKTEEPTWEECEEYRKHLHDMRKRIWAEVKAGTYEGWTGDPVPDYEAIQKAFEEKRRNGGK